MAVFQYKNNKDCKSFNGSARIQVVQKLKILDQVFNPKLQ